MKSNFVALGNFVEEIKQRVGTEKKTVYSVTNNRGFVPSSEVFDKQVFSADISNYKLVAHNDLAYNPSRINVGSVAICPDENGGAVSPMYTIVRCKRELLPQYLLYFLRSEKGESEINHRAEGAVRFQFKFKDLQRTPIYLPALIEQERIVCLLDEAEQLRKLRSQVSARVKEFIPALFHEMFGAGNYTQAKLIDCVSFISGGTPSKENSEFWGGDIPWVSPKDMKLSYINDSEDHITKKALAESNLKLIQENTVLMVVRGMILVHTVPIRINTVAVTINQDMKALIPKIEISPEYLRWSLQSKHSYILNQVSTAGHGTKRLETTKLQSLEISLPPLDLQREFAQRVQEARGVQSAQARSEERVESLYQSMLSRAFAGEL